MRATKKTVTRRRPASCARDIMSKNVVAVKPTMGLRAAAGVLHDHHITGAAVVTETGRLIGVLSETDLIERDAQPRVRTFELKQPPRGSRTFSADARAADVLDTVEKKVGDGTVGEVFSPYVVTARPETTVSELAAHMVRHRVHRVFIMDGAELVGIVSSMDVMRAVSTAPAR